MPSWRVSSTSGRNASRKLYLEILARISVLKPQSIAALARSLKRDFKNVYADVMFLGDLGLIELKEEGKRKTLIPIARFAGIEVDLGAAA